MASYYDSKNKMCTLSLKACWKYGVDCDNCKAVQDYNKNLELKNKVEYEPGISLEMEKLIQQDIENELKPVIKPKKEIKPCIKQETQAEVKEKKKGIIGFIKRILHLK